MRDTTCTLEHKLIEGPDMVDLARLRVLLGEPPNQPERSLDTVREAMDVDLPDEYAAFALAYGDLAVDEYLLFYGPASLLRSAHQQGPTLERIAEGLGASPHAVLPSPGGMLLWGATVEGDSLFLVDRGDKRWTVSAFVRQRGIWYESDQTLIDWLHTALTNDTSPQWLPAWESTHELATFS
jgi:hypothetical protein